MEARDAGDGHRHSSRVNPRGTVAMSHPGFGGDLETRTMVLERGTV
jgi:hypothetical protein